MKVKICGLTDIDQLKICIENKADFCGFILNYKKSHRNIIFDKVKRLTKVKKENTKFVGVLVNPTNEELKKFSQINLDYYQIYGDNTEESIFNIKDKYKIKIISAIQVKNREDILTYKKIEKNSDIILWDSSGLEKSLAWDFSWMESVPTNIVKMLAGNINVNGLEKLSKLTDIVDVSGALETNKVKDINKIKNFLNVVKKINEKN